MTYKTVDDIDESEVVKEEPKVSQEDSQLKSKLFDTLRDFAKLRSIYASDEVVSKQTSCIIQKISEFCLFKFGEFKFPNTEEVDISNCDCTKDGVIEVIKMLDEVMSLAANTGNWCLHVDLADSMKHCKQSIRDNK